MRPNRSMVATSRAAWRWASTRDSPQAAGPVTAIVTPPRFATSARSRAAPLGVVRANSSTRSPPYGPDSTSLSSSGADSRARTAAWSPRHTAMTRRSWRWFGASNRSRSVSVRGSALPLSTSANRSACARWDCSADCRRKSSTNAVTTAARSTMRRSAPDRSSAPPITSAPSCSPLAVAATTQQSPIRVKRPDSDSCQGTDSGTAPATASSLPAASTSTTHTSSNSASAAAMASTSPPDNTMSAKRS